MTHRHTIHVQGAGHPVLEESPGERSMTRDEIFAELRAMIAATLGIAPEKIREDSTFVGSLGMDSYAIVDLVFMIGERFGIPTKVDDFQDLHTVGSVAGHVVAVNAGESAP